jgi:hypothetical protein
VKSKLSRFFLAVVLPLVIACVALGVWAYHTAFSELPYNATDSQLASLEMKLRAFNLDTHSLPRTLEGLVISDGSANWQGPYAKSKDLIDPWGHPVQYEVLDPSSPSFRLSATGARKAIISRTVTPER